MRKTKKPAKRRNVKKRKSPLKGLLPRASYNDALPPNQDHGKYPDEVYGDTEIPRFLSA
jgi:hypothetical protein